MTKTVSNEPFTPWYREPWPWLIIGLLSVTFVWGSYRIYYAFKVQDSVVVDDYYKNGKSINQDLTRDQNAREQGISASLLIDELLGEVRVEVQGQLQHWPDTLQLRLLSPVFADRDATVSLRRSVSKDSEVIYVGQLDRGVSGRTYVQLETLDTLIPEVGYETGWRLNQELDIEPGKVLALQAEHSRVEQ